MRDFAYDKLADRTWPSDILNYVAKIHECKGRQDKLLDCTPNDIVTFIEDE